MVTIVVLVELINGQRWRACTLMSANERRRASASAGGRRRSRRRRSLFDGTSTVDRRRRPATAPCATCTTFASSCAHHKNVTAPAHPVNGDLSTIVTCAARA